MSRFYVCFVAILFSCLDYIGIFRSRESDFIDMNSQFCVWNGD